MNICILGAGGLGSAMGAVLAEGGVDVTLVGRPAHVDAIRSNGLRITGIGGDRVVRDHLRAVTTAEDTRDDFDYLVVLVKAKDTTSALAASPSVVDRTGVALSLQNTMTKEAELAEWFGPERVIGASTTVAGVLLAPGVVRHSATAPTACYFGEVLGGSSARVDQLVDTATATGITSKAAEDITHVEWEKLLQISTVAAWSVSTFGALGGSMAEGLAVREAAEHYVQLATELFTVYRAMGYEPRDFFAPFSSFRAFASQTFEESVESITAFASDMRRQGIIGRPSLHDDLLRGRTTEVDDGLGAYLAEAGALGVPTPTVDAAYRVIKSLEFWLVLRGGVDVSPLPPLPDDSE